MEVVRSGRRAETTAWKVTILASACATTDEELERLGPVAWAFGNYPKEPVSSCARRRASTLAIRSRKDGHRADCKKLRLPVLQPVVERLRRARLRRARVPRPFRRRRAGHEHDVTANRKEAGCRRSTMLARCSFISWGRL